MNKHQKQLLDSYIRIRAFLEAHPARGPLTYGPALKKFDDALEECRRHAATQDSATALSRAAQRQHAAIIKRIRDRHMRPIVTIARAQIEPGSDEGLPVSFRMPKTSIGATMMLACSDGMIDAAREYEEIMIAEGLPADFLDRFARARDELAASCERRATLRDARIGAVAGLPVALRRARLAVNRLDSVVRVAFDGDEMVLSTWSMMKRVHLLASGGEREAGERREMVESVPAAGGELLHLPAAAPVLALVAA